MQGLAADPLEALRLLAALLLHRWNSDLWDNLQGQAAERNRPRSAVADLGDAFDGVKLAGQMVAGDLGVVVGLHVDPEHVT
jgi:hypothetical protein